MIQVEEAQAEERAAKHDAVHANLGLDQSRGEAASAREEVERWKKKVMTLERELETERGQVAATREELGAVVEMTNKALPLEPPTKPVKPNSRSLTFLSFPEASQGRFDPSPILRCVSILCIPNHCSNSKQVVG